MREGGRALPYRALPYSPEQRYCTFSLEGRPLSPSGGGVQHSTAPLPTTFSPALQFGDTKMILKG